MRLWWGAFAFGVLAAASEPVWIRNGMVVSESAIASAAGVEVLRDGGNAVDAAVAAAFVEAVTLPAAGNLGGGGFLLYRCRSGAAVAYDFREAAPARAQAQMFVRGGRYDAQLHHHSHLAVGVPGTVAGLYQAWRENGRLPWQRLLRPAVAIAQDGFALPAGLARSLKEALPRLSNSAPALAQFSRKGVPYEAGDILKQPDLARTLRRVARRGPAGFYEGRVAESLECEMRQHGGWITRADLKAYQVRRREPVRGHYRGVEILSMPPPSSGGVTLIEMLNVLEGYDLSAAGFGTPTTVHLMAEAMRRGYAERARYLGDPDTHADVPVERLLSKAHAVDLRRTIRADRASVSSPDRFEWAIESGETTHLSVVDPERNAVALTYTLEESYGSGIMAPGTGFLLNNEMGDFNAAPGLTTTNGLIGTPPNLAAPGKRMLSSMAPTFLVKDGQWLLVVGSPGGRTIINTVLEVVVNLVDHRLELQAAVDAPRFHHQWLPDRIQFERGALEPRTVEQLRAMGHVLTETREPQGAVMAIRANLKADFLEGACDRRASDGAAIGWGLDGPNPVGSRR